MGFETETAYHIGVDLGPRLGAVFPPFLAPSQVFACVHLSATQLSLRHFTRLSEIAFSTSAAFYLDKQLVPEFHLFRTRDYRVGPEIHIKRNLFRYMTDEALLSLIGLSKYRVQNVRS